MSFEVDIGHCSRQGPRPGNEDFAGVEPPQAADARVGLIAAIADGVSTGGAGREAAQTTVMSLLADFHAAPDTWDTTVVLDRLISAQNTWLADHNRRRQSRHGESGVAMTTLTALVLRGQSWTVAHVGDTRAWLLRDGSCVQLTQDHAFEEAFQRSRLTRAVGLDATVRVDYAQGDVRAGDVFVLTSDGVHGAITRAELQALVASASTSGSATAQAASLALVEAAVKVGTHDNATALVVHVQQTGPARFEDLVLFGRDLPALGRRRAGEDVDGFTITALLADNDVHRLFQARTTQGDLVVLKSLHESRAGDAQERAMLAHEAWLAGRVAVGKATPREAGFVRVRPVTAASAHYVVFDWHAGATLEEWLRQGRRFEVAEVVAGAIAIARALGRLHRLAVIHRDIKPANLHLGDDGCWRVLDLGAALSGSDPAMLRALRAGTPSYMNPEQWGRDAAEPVAADTGSDLFAMGVTLYEWLTGKLPYGNVVPYQSGRFTRDPKPPSRLRPEVPIWLDHIVLKAVALDARQRFETAEEMVLALERGAARPLTAALATRDPAALWQIGVAISLLFNALLIYWLLFLPR